MTLNDKLKEILSDIQWLTLDFMQDSNSDCARAALDAGDAVAALRTKLESYGIENTEWGTLPPHPDDEAVTTFAAAMRDKLKKKRAEGYRGWDDVQNPQMPGRLARMLLKHLEKGDPLDIGCFAMMLFHYSTGSLALRIETKLALEHGKMSSITDDDEED